MLIRNFSSTEAHGGTGTLIDAEDYLSTKSHGGGGVVSSEPRPSTSSTPETPTKSSLPPLYNPPPDYNSMLTESLLSVNSYRSDVMGGGHMRSDVPGSRWPIVENNMMMQPRSRSRGSSDRYISDPFHLTEQGKSAACPVI